MPEVFVRASVAHHQRDLFARMIGPAVGRVIAMVGRDDQQVIFRAAVQEPADPSIKLQQGAGVSVGIAPMAKGRIEIDQVCEDQARVCVIPDRLNLPHAVAIRLGRIALGDAFAREKVDDLSHRLDRKFCILNRIENGARRLHRKIMPTARARELLRFADERAGDHSTNAIGIRMQTGDAADVVQTLNRDDALVGRDLKHRIRRGVQNRLAGSHVLGAEALDDFRSAGGAIPKKAHAGFALDRLHEWQREVLKNAKWLGQNRAGEFPMSGRAVLPSGDFRHFPIAGDDGVAGPVLEDMPQPQRPERRQD